jgi:hypothetical protein
MKLRHFSRQLIALAVLFASFLSACATPTPSVLIVTITPRSAVAAEVTTTPLTTTTASQAAASPVQTKTPAPFGPVVEPNVTPLVQPTYQVTVTIATRVPPTPGGPTNTPGGFGPVAGPNVTPVVQPTALPTTPGQPPQTSPTSPLPAVPTIAPTSSTAGGPTSTQAFGPAIPPNYTPPPSFTPGPPPTLPPVNVTLPPLVTPGPSPTPGPILRSSLMGIQIHGHLKDDEWAKMLAYSKDLGMGWIKVQIQWKELEPAKGVFNELYRGMVINIQRARIQGFRTMISVAKAPGWSRPAGFAQNEDGPPDNPQDLANFIAQIIRDCKPEFVDAVEIWNEPNLIREWRGKPMNGGEYMKYFRPAYAAIQDEQKRQPVANHRITVITAGLAPVASTPDGSAIDDRGWLQQMYSAGLAQVGPDVVIGIHPYGWANPPDATCCAAQPGVTGWYQYRVFYFRNTLEDYRNIMVQNKHASSKLWVTEFGWATYDGLRRSDGNPASADSRVGWQNNINQGQQANYVVRAFHMAQQPPFYDYLGPMMLWNLNFGIIPNMINESREEAGFSLLDVNWNPRPVYFAVKNAQKQQ